MISSTSNRSELVFSGIQNGVLFTATETCLVVFYSQFPTSGTLGLYRGGSLIMNAAGPLTQRGVMMKIGDSLIASSLSIPFKLTIIQL